MSTFLVDGINLHYEVGGAGDPLRPARAVGSTMTLASLVPLLNVASVPRTIRSGHRIPTDTP